MSSVPSTAPQRIPSQRFDPYSVTQLIAAALVVAIPTLLAFILGFMLDGMLTAALWAVAIGALAGSVIATSALVAHVGVIPAVLGISGIWGGLAAFVLWLFAACPDWLSPVNVCGPRQYATVISLGMLAPWFVVTFVLPIPLFGRWVWRRLSGQPGPR